MQVRRNDDSGLDRGGLPAASGTLEGVARKGSDLETQATRKSTQRSERRKSLRTPALTQQPSAPGPGELPAEASRPVPETPAATSLSDSERYRQISLCAYFRAESRGFEPGHMWDDWLAAEREVAERKVAPRADAVREGAERNAAEQRGAESPSEKP